MSMALSLSFVRFGCRADPGSAGTVPAKKRCDFTACPPDSAKRTPRVRVGRGQVSGPSVSLAPRSGERVGERGPLAGADAAVADVFEPAAINVVHDDLATSAVQLDGLTRTRVVRHPFAAVRPLDQRQTRLAVRNDEDLPDARQTLVVPQLLPAIVVFGRRAGDLDDENRIHHRQ